MFHCSFSTSPCLFPEMSPERANLKSVLLQVQFDRSWEQKKETIRYSAYSLKLIELSHRPETPSLGNRHAESGFKKTA